MKIITSPYVYLIGRPSINDADLDRFLADHDVSHWSTDTEVAAEKLVEVGGRLCYMSFAQPRPGGNAAYVGHILEVGHGSVLEHAAFTFIITGASRSFTHELVRHRAGMSYSQLSQRYADESDCEFVVPPAIESEVVAARALMARFQEPIPRARDVLDYMHRHADVDGMHEMSVEEAVGLRWLMAVEESQRCYMYLADYISSRDRNPDLDTTTRRKRAREAARSVLPNATETKIQVTANARALRHFVEMRGDAAADAEIRAVAVAMLRVLQTEAPNLFGDYEVVPEPNGFGEVIQGKHRKV